MNEEITATAETNYTGAGGRRATTPRPQGAVIRSLQHLTVRFSFKTSKNILGVELRSGAAGTPTRFEIPQEQQTDFDFGSQRRLATCIRAFIMRQYADECKTSGTTMRVAWVR